MNDPDYNNQKPTVILSVLGFIALSFILVIFVVPMIEYASKEGVRNKLSDQTFYVATKGGEAFEVKAMHKCGDDNMRRAAIHASQNQDSDMRFHAAEKVLEAVTMDYARIYDGNTKEGTRCEITGVTFTNITGKAYIVEE